MHAPDDDRDDQQRRTEAPVVRDLQDAGAFDPDAIADYSWSFAVRSAELVPGVDPEAQHLVFLLTRVAALLAYDMESGVHRPTGLGWTSFYVVAILALTGPIESSRVASIAGLSRASVSAIVKTLVRDGWVERSTKESDRRAVLLGLTPTGRERVPALFLQMDARQRTWAAALEPEDRTRLIQLLTSFVTNAPADLRQRR